MTKIKIMLILLVCFLAGCVKEVSQPKTPFVVSNEERWKTLAPFIKNHFDTGNKTLEEIVADLLLAEYELNEDKANGK